MSLNTQKLIAIFFFLVAAFLISSLLNSSSVFFFVFVGGTIYILEFYTADTLKNLTHQIKRTLK